MPSTIQGGTTDIRDLTDGDVIDQVMLVRSHELRHTRNGSEFLKLTLSDRTGTVPGVVWDAVTNACSLLGAGEPLRIVGTYSEGDRYGPQLTVHELYVPVTSIGSGWSMGPGSRLTSSSSRSTPSSANLPTAISASC
jgi:hypothetical protein